MADHAEDVETTRGGTLHDPQDQQAMVRRPAKLRRHGRLKKQLFFIPNDRMTDHC
jgi:hypothetical protein